VGLKKEMRSMSSPNRERRIASLLYAGLELERVSFGRGTLLLADEEIVAVVLHFHEAAQKGPLVNGVAHRGRVKHSGGVLLGREPSPKRHETDATTTLSRRVSRAEVAAWRSRSISSLIELSFSM
jgi:hypothetical protein